jgi:GDP-L-fucose synthase
MQEPALLSGRLELTNEPDAIAKLTEIKLLESCSHQYSRDYRSVMPTNLYGQNDNLRPEKPHAISPLIRHFHHTAAKQSAEVTIWESNEPKRNFLMASMPVIELNKASYAACI